jgi:4-hydroxybenzoate polyprenyltransferase
LIAWLQLLRLPNVFTAVADVMMGYVVTHGHLQPPAHFLALVLVSCSLYLSGMVLNDVFDADVDARDRPHRPIPSGGVTRRAAAACGLALLASGLIVAAILSLSTHDWRPAVIAALLAACILLYDYVLKPTPVAPLFMGACRMLNVLLGMSLAPPPSSVVGMRFLVTRMRESSVAGLCPHEWLIALGIGIYIMGVTIFARTEARTSTRAQLVAGLIVLLAGIGLLTATPVITGFVPTFAVSQLGWFFLWGALALIIARRCVIAVVRPAPHIVQSAVRTCVQAIIVLDAAICVGYAGPMWGFAILALMLPTFALTQWLKST